MSLSPAEISRYINDGTSLTRSNKEAPNGPTEYKLRLGDKEYSVITDNDGNAKSVKRDHPNTSLFGKIKTFFANSLRRSNNARALNCFKKLGNAPFTKSDYSLVRKEFKKFEDIQQAKNLTKLTETATNLQAIFRGNRDSKMLQDIKYIEKLVTITEKEPSSLSFATKGEATKALCDLFSHSVDRADGSNCYNQFKALANQADPEHFSKFKLRLFKDGDKNVAELFIDNITVAKEEVTSVQLTQIQAQIGKVGLESGHDSLVMGLEIHKAETADLGALSDNNYEKEEGTGGVNKKYDATTGVLKGMNQTAIHDFDKETRLDAYIKNTNNATELARYISLQVKINPDDLPSNGLDRSKPYASVTRYKDEVKSRELDVCLPNPITGLSPDKDNQLSPDEKRAVATQLVDMLRVMYKSEISHRDLHSHNLLVHRFNDGEGKPVTMLKAIDFGRAKFGSDHKQFKFETYKFEDIDYIFKKIGANGLETVGRNTFLKKTGNSKLEKHYPMHNLLQNGARDKKEVKSFLNNIHNSLIKALEAKDIDSDKIDTAFFKASQWVEQSFSKKLSEIKVPKHFDKVQ